MRAIPRTITQSSSARLWAVLDIDRGDENHDPIVAVYSRKYMAHNWVEAEAEIYRQAGGKGFKTLDGWNLGDRQLRIVELPPVR